MFCPKCKAEYVSGVTTCADCHVPLVHELPAEPEKNKDEEEIECSGKGGLTAEEAGDIGPDKFTEADAGTDAEPLPDPDQKDQTDQIDQKD